jgi:hypothetical protein
MLLLISFSGLGYLVSVKDSKSQMAESHFYPTENDCQVRELQNYGGNLAFPTSKF